MNKYKNESSWSLSSPHKTSQHQVLLITRSKRQIEEVAGRLSVKTGKSSRSMSHCTFYSNTGNSFRRQKTLDTEESRKRAAAFTLSHVSFTLAVSNKLLNEHGYSSEENLWNTINAQFGSKLQFYIIPSGFLTSVGENAMQIFRDLIYSFCRHPISYVWGCWDKKSSSYGALLLSGSRYNTSSDDGPSSQIQSYYNSILEIVFDKRFPRNNREHDSSFMIVDVGHGECEELKERWKCYTEIEWKFFEYKKEFILEQMNSFEGCQSFDDIKLIEKMKDLWSNVFGKFLKLAYECVEYLYKGNAVMILYQGDFSHIVLTSLIQVMIDPKYRTLKGLCNLIYSILTWEVVIVDKCTQNFRSHIIILLTCIRELLIREPLYFQYNQDFLQALYYTKEKIPEQFLKSISDNYHIYLSPLFIEVNNYKWLPNVTTEYSYWSNNNIIQENNHQENKVILGNLYWPQIFLREINEKLLQDKPDIITKLQNVSKESTFNWSLAGEARLLWFPPQMEFNPSWTDFKVNSGLYLLDLPQKFSILAGNLTSLSIIRNWMETIPHVVAFLTNLTTLNFAQNRVSYIPSKIFSTLTNLSTLNLNDNALVDLNGTCQFSHLTCLQASNNFIMSFPFHLKQWEELEILLLPTNRIKEVPKRLNELHSLKELQLQRNNIRLVHNITLPLLEKLYLHRNEITSLPDSIGNCITLQELILDNNQITYLPAKFSNLQKLLKLSIAENQLVEIPPWISSLVRLTSLNFMGNQILTVPYNLCAIAGLLNVNLANNKIKKIPLHMASFMQKLTDKKQPINIDGNTLKIVAGSGNMNIIDHLKKKLSTEVEIRRAKVLVIGSDQAGKSSFIEAITQKWKEVPYETKTKHEEKNENTDIRVRTYTIDTARGKKKVEPMVTHIWDFSGLDAFNASHQFLLTTNAIIILVFDFHKEGVESDITHWLKLLKERLSRPKVILVGTKLDKFEVSQSAEQIEERVQRYKQEFHYLAHIVHFCVVSTKIENGKYVYPARIKKARQIIEQSIPSNKFTKSFQLFEALLKDQMKTEDYPVINQVGLSRLAEICSVNLKNGDLTKYTRALHEYGSILYFDKIPQLKDFVILNPQWLFELAETIFELAETIFKNTDKSNTSPNPGILKKSDFKNGWKKYSQDIHNKLFFILDRFNIVLDLQNRVHKFEKSTLGKSSFVASIDASQFVLIPTMLPKISKEEIEKETEKLQNLYSLTRIYHCPSYMPNTVFSRIIIGLFELADSVDRVWAQGLNFTTNNIIVDIQLYPRITKTAQNEGDELTLFVRGKDKQQIRELFYNLLNVVDSNIEGMTDKGVVVKKYIKIDVNGVPKEILLDDIIHSMEGNSKEVALSNLGISNGKSQVIQFEDIVPEVYIPEYKGRRLTKSDIVIQEMMGIGGYSKVYKGTLDNMEVAIKELTEQNDARVLSEFRHEVSIHGNLSHPNILKILGICLVPSKYMVVEMCPFGDVYDYLHNWKEKKSWKLRLLIALDIAKAIQYLHNMEPKIAHLDLKTPNVLIQSLSEDAPTRVKVIDFGTSQIVTTKITIKKVDNPVWLAPEILKQEPYNQQVDTYAFGVILFELITRRDYFEGSSFVDIEEAVTAGQRPPIPEGVQLHPQYKTIMENCWAQEPEFRPLFDDIISTLTELLSENEKWENSQDEYEEKLKNEQIQKELEIQLHRKQQEEKKKKKIKEEKIKEKGTTHKEKETQQKKIVVYWVDPLGPYQHYSSIVEQAKRLGVDLWILEKTQDLKDKLQLESKLPKKERKLRSIRIISSRTRQEDGEMAGENMCEWLKNSEKWKDLNFLLFCGAPSLVKRFTTDVSRGIWVSNNVKILTAFLMTLDMRTDEDVYPKSVK